MIRILEDSILSSRGLLTKVFQSWYSFFEILKISETVLTNSSSCSEGVLFA